MGDAADNPSQFPKLGTKFQDLYCVMMNCKAGTNPCLIMSIGASLMMYHHEKKVNLLSMTDGHSPKHDWTVEQDNKTTCLTDILSVT